MSLPALFKLLRRWWWLILLPAIPAGLYGLLTYREPAITYAVTLKYTAGQPAEIATAPGYDPNYYRWLTSEYIVTALKDWVRSGQFAEAVNAQLTAAGHTPPLGAVVASDNSRSILVVSMVSNTPENVLALAAAVTTVLQEQNAQVFPQLGGQAAVITPLDTPAPGPIAPGWRDRLDLPLKVGLGLALGLALAFAAHYFDPRLHDKTEAEALGLRVLGEIPRSKGQKPRLETRD